MCVRPLVSNHGQQESCKPSKFSYIQRTANDLHQKLIQQHKDFLKKRAEMEAGSNKSAGLRVFPFGK